MHTAVFIQRERERERERDVKCTHLLPCYGVLHNGRCSMCVCVYIYNEDVCVHARSSGCSLLVNKYLLYFVVAKYLLYFVVNKYLLYLVVS